MAMKEQQRSVYRTARGRELDMNKMVNQNELTIAVGNAKVNARGDKLGPDGKIIQRRETTPVKTIKNVVDMDPEGHE